ncbi:AAA family ATPase [Nostocoides australiense]
MTITDQYQIPLAARTSRAPVKTDAFKDAYVKARHVIDQNAIMAIDGPPGTGKTTFSVFTADRVNRPAAVVVMPSRPAPLDLLRLTHKAVTGEPAGTASRYQLGDALMTALPTWGGVLVVDELQNCAVNAMQELVWLHEVTAGAFSIVAVGHGVLHTIRGYPQLHSRVLSTAVFTFLAGDELVTTVSHLHPALANADVSDLHLHDRLACRGLFRAWGHTATTLTALGVHDRPVIADDFE